MNQSAAVLRGVGARTGALLARLGVESLGDLLTLLPLRYEDRTRVQPIGAVRPGEKVLVHGRIELTEVAMRRRRSLLCRISDGTGSVTLRFFHFNSQQQQRLRAGTLVRCFGEVRNGPTGIEMVHPECRFPEANEPIGDTALTPVYPSTEGLQQHRLRNLVEQALQRLANGELADPLSSRLNPALPSLAESLRVIHRPPQDSDVADFQACRSPWHQRLALEELVAHRLALKSAQRMRRIEQAAALVAAAGIIERFLGNLPFELTTAQARVVEEIQADMALTEPMCRLLQGDVGCGKTIVAAIAALIAASNDRQVAVMAPTELLAEQHAQSFRAWLEPLGLRVALMTGSLGTAQRRQMTAALAAGDTSVIVGTHALFQESVSFHRLGLVIVDEQHRFGVEQRLRLWRKAAAGGEAAHQLIMTATPIPRTLAMTAYADLECSSIDELPPGRTPVRTVVMQESRKPDIVARVNALCRTGQQVYWVCPLIDESEHIESTAAAEIYAQLAQALPELRIGLVHGRMRAAEKDAVMREFKSGAIHVLVATTVIEVGVDVPNASLMVIENAERMGLAQLHQLRGRVGRGSAAASCVLLYRPPLGRVARERLSVMRQTTDGFAIAQADLRLRGAGEVLGTRQTGEMQLKIADLVRDAELLPDAIRLSDELAADSTDSAGILLRRWIAGGDQYAHV